MQSLFSTLSDIIALNFDPAAGTYPDLTMNTAVNLVGFKIDVKNQAVAGAGNKIALSTGDNYAIDIYLAKVNLGTTPAGTKTTAFPATLNTGDLKVALAVGATTSPQQVMTANGITLPTADCNQYTWLCGCVKKGGGAQYVDSDTTNNCDCADASSKIKCLPGMFANIIN